ncbi:MAG: hypothetical protein K1X81_12200 [Bacteroidia bacterium]|nr:hypothetical protein [Bacteroidia bacterium]
MKYLAGIIFILALAACSKKVELTPHEPSVTFNEPASVSVFSGGIVYLNLKTQANAGLFTLQVLHSLNGAAEVTDTTIMLTGTTFTWPFEYTVPDMATLPATIRLFFVVTDLKGKRASASFVISVINNPVDLGVLHNGVVYNVNATSKNAQWDLVNNAARQLADSLNYDLMNTTHSAAANMEKGWRSPATYSFTEFVKTSAVNFDNATSKELINVWNNPFYTHVARVKDIAVGDLLVVWLRNGAFGIIKITQIDDTTPGADNQFIRFVYKKQE